MGLSCSNCPNPIASPSKNITYTIVATDSNNCTSSEQIELIVNNYTIPNSITPNGDNYNEFLIIPNADTSIISIIIYNRWGEIVFKSNNYKNNWNGKNTDGSDLLEDTYFYDLREPNKKNRSGFIKLIR
jgi:gliding motility-associated-like protein